MLPHKLPFSFSILIEMNTIIAELRTISDSIVELNETISSSTFPYFDQYLDATFNGGDDVLLLLPAFQQACMGFNADFRLFEDYGSDFVSVSEALWKGRRDSVTFSPLNEAFTLACRNGDSGTVSRLLRGPIDPSANDNSALVAACENCHVDIVETLLKHTLVDAHIKNKCQKAFETYYSSNYLRLCINYEDFRRFAKIISRL